VTERGYLRCDTQEAIAARVGMTQPWVNAEIAELSRTETLPILIRQAISYEDAGWTPSARWAGCCRAIPGEPRGHVV
jgi:hypothetical protein